MKYRIPDPAQRRCGPTPHGVGGLKCGVGLEPVGEGASHPTRGGWIEILTSVVIPDGVTVPPHTGWVD